MPRLLAVLIASFALVIAGCGDSKDKEQSATTTPEDAATVSATPGVLPEGCENVDKPAPKKSGGRKSAPKKEGGGIGEIFKGSGGKAIINTILRGIFSVLRRR